MNLETQKIHRYMPVLFTKLMQCIHDLEQYSLLRIQQWYSWYILVPQITIQRDYIDHVGIYKKENQIPFCV